MEAKAVLQAPRRLSAWPVYSSSPLPGGGNDSSEQGCEPTARLSFEHKAVRFTLEDDTVIDLDGVNSKSQSSTSGWQDEPFPAALRERKSKMAGAEPPLGQELAQQLGPQLGSQVCHVVRIVLAEEASKFTEQLSSLRKELAAALAEGRREQSRGTRAARAERREQGADRVNRESFDSRISSTSEMSEPSEGEFSGHSVKATSSAGHLEPNPGRGRGHPGQAATCPELITLEEDASVGSPRDLETDDRVRTASTAAETPQGPASTRVTLLATHFCSETSSCVGKNTKLQALMRLPTEQEEKERRSSLAQEKMRHPAQVETMGSLADFLPKRSLKERRQLQLSEGEAAQSSQGISPQAPSMAHAASTEDCVSAKTTTSSLADRAHMIGVKSARTNNNDTWAKRKGTRDLQKLEKSLASELFAAKDLVSAPKSSKPKPRSSSNRPMASRCGAMLRGKSNQDDASRNFTTLRQPSPAQKNGRSSTASNGSSPKGDATAIQTDEEKPDLQEEALRGDEETGLVHESTAPSTSSTGDIPVELRKPRASASQTKKMPTISALRQKHEEEITKDLQQAELPSERSEEQSPTLEKAVKVVLALPKACGVLPWGGRWRIASAVYQHTVALVAAGSVAVCALQVADEFREQRDGETPLSPCVDLILAIGSFAALLACMALCKRKALADAMKLIVNSARREGFVTQWQRESCRDGCCNLFLWLLAVVLRAWYNIDGRLAAFAFSTLLQTGMACLIMHCCRCLMKLIDNFCCGIVETPNYVEAMTEWNLFQALCRTACGSLQFCFIAIQGTATAVVLLAIAEVQRGISGFLEMMPGLLVALMVTQISLRAAAVTDKCARVPMLVNSVSAACDLDRDRMYVVEYIVHSQAGFYIFEVRLTSATVMKACYVACAVAFGLASQLL